MPTSTYELRNNVAELKMVVMGILTDLNGKRLVDWTSYSEGGKHLIEVEYKDK